MFKIDKLNFLIGMGIISTVLTIIFSGAIINMIVQMDKHLQKINQ